MYLDRQPPYPHAIYFDDFAVTVGRPVWVVEVEGVPEGWTVKLKSASNIIDEKTAGPDGVVRLIVVPSTPIDLIANPNNRDRPVIPKGVIEVYDQNGNKVLEKFPLIVGGDKYRLTSP